MTPVPPTREPRQFIAGDTIQWTKQLADYPPADGWTLHYKLNGPSTLSEDVDVDVSGDMYEVTIPAAATAFPAFVAGAYRMIGYVDNVAGERHTIYRADIEILPNVAAVSYANLRTHDEKMLAAIQAALEGRSSADIEQYQIDGTAITKIPMERLLQLQGIYQYKVWRQANPDVAFPSIEMAFAAEGGSSPTADPNWFDDQ